MVPAAPVVVLPFETDEPRSNIERKKTKDHAKLERDQSSGKTVQSIHKYFIMGRFNTTLLEEK